MKKLFTVFILSIFIFSAASCSIYREDTENSLYAGWASSDITPPLAVELAGANYTRNSEGVESTLFVTALALSNANQTEQHVIASLDLIEVDCAGFINEVRNYISENKDRAEGLNLQNIVLFATHTHCGPRLAEWETPSGYVMGKAPEGGMGATEYRKYITPIVGETIISAWQNRERSYLSSIQTKSGFGWNRISVYEDGSQVMYGSTSVPGYVGPLSVNDQNLNLIYIYNLNKELKGVVMGIGFPFQTCESLMQINADIMQPIREKIGGDFHVLPLISAAGDQSPYDLESSWQDKYGGSRILMRDTYGRTIARMILKYAENGEALKAIQQKTILSSSVTTANTYYPVELHALRLGNTAIVSNPLELYIDWGIKIKTESPADLTIIGQLSSNTSSQHHGLGYGPTKKALDGAGYGGNNNILSLEDINLLVDTSIDLVKGLYP